MARVLGKINTDERLLSRLPDSPSLYINNLTHRLVVRVARVCLLGLH